MYTMRYRRGSLFDVVTFLLLVFVGQGKDKYGTTKCSLNYALRRAGILVPGSVADDHRTIALDMSRYS